MERRSSTLDISWFLDSHRTKQLNLEPTYQRRSVWSTKDRRFFLDTIFRGYPSPAIYLHKETTDTGKTVYNVVDGKQRLETIMKFAGNKIAIASDYGDSRLDGKRWKDIKRDNPELIREFWDYVLPIEFISVDKGITFINDVFDRLNRNSRKLVDQELRHAKYEGWFITFVENECDNSDWKTLCVATTSKAKRMKDAQNLSELLITLLKGAVGGFSQDEINNFYAVFEDPSDLGVDEDEALDIDFDEDDIRSRFEKARKFLVDVEMNNEAISKYAKDFKDLYSLWALIVLNVEKFPEATVFASKYVDFMKNVNIVKECFKTQIDMESLSQKDRSSY